MHTSKSIMLQADSPRVIAMRARAKIRRMAFVMALALGLGSVPVPALSECKLDVLKAYETAKSRGWQFKCPALPGVVAGFVTYPPSTIGCTFKTGMAIPPAVPMYGPGQGALMLFGAQAGVPVLKNGWEFVRYEISGGTFQILPQVTAIVSAGVALGKSNHTYNYKISSLVLKKKNGYSICGRAIHEAF